MDLFLRYGFSANSSRSDTLPSDARHAAGRKGTWRYSRGIRNTAADATGWIASRTKLKRSQRLGYGVTAIIRDGRATDEVLAEG